MEEQKKRKGRFKTEASKELDTVVIDKTEFLETDNKDKSKRKKRRTKAQIKEDNKVKSRMTYNDLGKSDLTVAIQSRKKKKTGIYKYIEITPEMITDLDEVRLEVENAFHHNTDGFITKAEIIAGSVFRPYVEQEMLEDKHVIFLYFLKKCFGNITRACERMGISRRTPIVWMESNSIFRAIIEDFQEGFLDDTEEMLRALINEKNVQAVMFHLKTKGKSRGYIEKQTLELVDKTEVVGFEFIDANLSESNDFEEANLIEYKGIEEDEQK